MTFTIPDNPFMPLKVTFLTVAVPSSNCNTAPGESPLAEEVSRLKEAERVDMKSHPLDGNIAPLTRKCGGRVHKQEVVDVTASSCRSPGLKVHVDRAEGLVSDKKEGLDTYVKFEIEGRKAKIKSRVVQNSFDPIYDDDVFVWSPNPEWDVLVITVVSKEVVRDESICDKVKIPVKDFLPVGKSEERVLDLKKKKGVGRLYLTFVST